jgi:hypothetical protein
MHAAPTLLLVYHIDTARLVGKKDVEITLLLYSQISLQSQIIYLLFNREKSILFLIVSIYCIEAGSSVQ